MPPNTPSGAPNPEFWELTPKNRRKPVQIEGGKEIAGNGEIVDGKETLDDVD